MNTNTLQSERRAKLSEARKLSRKIKDDTPAAEAAKMERGFDLLMADVDDINERLSEARDEQPDPRRPLPNGEARGVDGGREDDEHTQAFASYLRAPLSARAAAALTDAEARAGSMLTGPAGGYVVPSLIATPLMARARDANPFRSIVRVADVASSDVSFPLSNSDATSGWVGETDPRSATTEPTLVSKTPSAPPGRGWVNLYTPHTGNRSARSTHATTLGKF